MGGQEGGTNPIPDEFIDRAALVLVTYNGSGPFTVQTLSSTNQTEQVLVDTKGTYNGVEAMDFDGSSPAAAVQVIDPAGGPWTVTFADPNNAPTFSGEMSGQGDAVLDYGGAPGTADITGAASAAFDFRVIEYTMLGSSGTYLADAYGPFSGTHSVDGTAWLVIHCDGRWTISVKAGTG